MTGDGAGEKAARRIRLGLVGTGLAVELLHWPALRQLTDRYEVTAFADRSEEQARRFAAYSGVPMAGYTADYRELLARDDVDAVLVCLPIPLLYDATRAALSAGKDVLCEKPTGTDEEQARAFLALETEFGDRTVLVGENLFYRDDIRLARSLVDGGALGRLHLMSWRTAGRLVPRAGSFTGTAWRQRPAYRGGVHLDAGVHHVAQIRMLCGDVTRLHGQVQQANATIDSPTDLTLNLEFAGGAIGNYTACHPDIAVYREPNEMRLYGTDGVLVLSGSRGERRVVHGRPDGSAQTYTFSGIDNGYLAELRNFHGAVVAGEPVVGTVRQSFTNMVVILRALDSAETGEAVDLGEGTAAPAGPAGVPLWRPPGSAGLFDGLPGELKVTGAEAAAGR